MVGCVRHTACTKRSLFSSKAVCTRRRAARGKRSDFSARFVSRVRIRSRRDSICTHPIATSRVSTSYELRASKNPSDFVETSFSSFNSIY